MCLVDEVIETVLDDVTAEEASAMPGVVATDKYDEFLGQVPPPNQVDSTVGESSIAPTAVREMLQNLYDSPDMVVPPLEEEEEKGGE